MSESWYEMNGPSRKEVYKDMMNHFTQKYLFTRNIGYNIMNYGHLSLIVKKLMAEEFDKYGVFGSYRGYATFTRRTLIEGLMEKLKTRKLEIAFILRSIYYTIH